MTKKKILDQVRSILVQIHDHHEQGLYGIDSGNCHEVLTRFGIEGTIAEACSLVMETIEEDEDEYDDENYNEDEDQEFCPCCLHINQIIDLLATMLNAKGQLNEPIQYDCEGVDPGEKDENGLFTHPNLLFTAVNFNARRYGIEADASACMKEGLPYYQDWCSHEEILEAGCLVNSVWDAQEGRFLSPQEIAKHYPHVSKN